MKLSNDQIVQTVHDLEVFKEYFTSECGAIPVGIDNALAYIRDRECFENCNECQYAVFDECGFCECKLSWAD